MEGASPNTIRSYRAAVGQWIEAGMPSPQDWYAQLREAGRSAATINQRRAAVSSFQQWAGERDDFVAAHGVKQVEQPRSSLSLADVAKLLDACEVWSNDPMGRARLAAMIALQVSAGLRTDEMCKLELKNIDAETRTAWVIGKGGKLRPIKYGVEAGRRIAAWLEHRAPSPDSGLLFCTRTGREIDQSNYRRDLARASWWASLPPVTPHTLRHTFATLAIESKMPVHDLKEMLGHANVTTTQRYIHSEQRAAWSEYDQRHPLSGEVE